MRKRLFIIGAGASKQIGGYPTGLELLEKIKTYFVSISPGYNEYFNDGNSLRDEINLFNGSEEKASYIVSSLHKSSMSQEFKSSAILSLLIKIYNPSSIDYFIQNL